MNYFDCIIISTINLAHLILTNTKRSHWFYDFSIVAPAPGVRKAWDLMGTSVWNGLRLFLLFGKKYCFTEKLNFLIDNLFRNVF